MRKLKKGALLAALSGATLFGFGGCLGGGNGIFRYLLQGAALTAGGDTFDAFIGNSLFLGQDVTNGIAYSTAIDAACKGITDAAAQAICRGGLVGRP